MARTLSVVTARTGKIVQKTGFKNYDLCLNTYVGCQFGCQYCYVRFFVKDPKYAWGEFVRARKHVTNQLPKELPMLVGKRVVLGTMTDPYQPQERTHRITREALTIISQMQTPPDKVGIFTRSPVVLDDAALIAKLPKARVHFSITPFTRDIMTKIEGIAVQTRARWETIQKLRAAGIRIHVNVAPAIPIISDSLTREYAEKLSEIGVEEFFVDPMETYKDSFKSLENAMNTDPAWPSVKAIMTNDVDFQKWKGQYKKDWETTWKRVGNPKTLAIWSDHTNDVWTDMATGTALNHRYYGT